MKLTTKHTVAVIILGLGFATPVVAGPLEAADAAVKRRDYATAVRLVRPLAEQGDANAQYNLGSLLRQRPWCPAGQGQRTHVVQLVGGARQRWCGSFSRPYRTAHDPRADSRSTETHTRLEAELDSVTKRAWQLDEWRNVRYWHKADISVTVATVRFWG